LNPEILLSRCARPVMALASAAMIVFLTASCVGARSSQPDVAGRPLSVVTTIPTLADLARNVGGGLVEVRPLLSPGADVHSFQTTPKDSVVIAGASVVIANGEGLDDFLMPALTGSMGDSAVLVIASAGVAEVEPGVSLEDPHLWQDPVLAIHYVEQIRDGLIHADPDNASAYRDNAQRYTLRLRELDLEISSILGQVPAGNRRLVSYHRAFSHLGRRYGWRTHALVTDDGAAVTPSDILRLARVIEDNALPSVFAEPELPTSALETAANESQASLASIYAGLAREGPSTYIDMMLFNAHSLAGNLR
jgi:ABC-type Zn uptake system ZnuABC Zn-binding protein ZnuA